MKNIGKITKIWKKITKLMTNRRLPYNTDLSTQLRKFGACHFHMSRSVGRCSCQAEKNVVDVCKGRWRTCSPNASLLEARIASVI